MPTPELLCVVAISISLGYYLGRRSAKSAPPWYARTRRSRLARQAFTLMVLGAATQFRRSLRRRFRPARGPITSLTRHAAMPLSILSAKR